MSVLANVNELSTSAYSPSLRSKKDSNLNGHFGFISNQLNREVGDVPGNRYNGNFGIDYHRVPYPYSSGIEARFTAAALHNDQSLTMYSVQEAYIAGNLFTDQYSVKAGRQILDWSAVDATWGFGKLNNRRNFDFFEPGQEGLTGLQFERKGTNGVRIKAFYSYIYVPETNPGLDLDRKNKTITSRNPWAKAPNRTVNQDGVNYNVFYDVEYPEISDVVFRHSAGLNLGWENKHWAFDNFYMRKPENNISVRADLANAVDPIAGRVEVRVNPEIYYHDVYGSTLRYRNQDLQMYVSGIAVRPNTFPDGNQEVTRLTNIKTKKIREDYMGGGISKINDVYGVGINYVARLSPFDRQREELADDPRWNQAVNVFLMRNLGRSFSVSTDLKYDMLTTDRLFMLRGTYNASRELQLTAGVNMIGTPTDGKSYWHTFTNNDSVYAGLRYIF